MRMYWRKYVRNFKNFIVSTLNKKRKEQVKLIPEGFYCYSGDFKNKRLCPFWSVDFLHPEAKFPQEYGYCAFLHMSDFDLNEKIWTEIIIGKRLSNGRNIDTIYRNKSYHQIGLRTGALWTWDKECGFKLHP